jgi:hypothetical protein
MLSYPLFAYLYVILQIEARLRGTSISNWSTWSCTKKQVMSLITFFDLIMFMILNHHGTIRLTWWDLIGYLVCLPYTLHTNELLGSIASALLGFGLILLMIHAHVPLWFIIVSFIIMHDKIILFNWNMEWPPETTMQPQGLYGSGLGQLIRKPSVG